MQEAPAGGKGQGVAAVPENNGRHHPAGGREEGGSSGNPGLCMLAQPPAGTGGLDVQGWLRGVCPEKPEPPDGRKQGRKKAEQIIHPHGTICALPIPRSFSGCRLFLKTVRFAHRGPPLLWLCLCLVGQNLRFPCSCLSCNSDSWIL